MARRARGRAAFVRNGVVPEGVVLRTYFHVVYTLPAPIADIAYQNKRVIYDLLFKASAETTLTIAADLLPSAPRHGIAKRYQLSPYVVSGVVRCRLKRAACRTGSIATPPVRQLTRPKQTNRFTPLVIWASRSASADRI